GDVLLQPLHRLRDSAEDLGHAALIQALGDGVPVAHRLQPLRIYQSAWAISKTVPGSGSALFGAGLVGLDLFPRGLAFEAERGHRAGHQALEADRLAALLAFVDIASVEAPERVLDLAQQKRLPICET